MGQTLLFILLVITLIVGALGYFSPRLPGSRPVAIQAMKDMGDDQMTGQTVTKESRQMNITTNAGGVQINEKIDVLTRQQKDLRDVIEAEKSALDNTNKEIFDLSKQVNGKNDLDVLRLNALTSHLQDEKTLLVAHGRQLIALNDQISKERNSLAEEREGVDINTVSTLRSLQDRNISINDQSSIMFDNVKNKNNDSMQHVKDLMDEERQKAQDRRDR